MTGTPDRAHASLQERPGVLHNPWGPPSLWVASLISAWSPDVLKQEVKQDSRLPSNQKKRKRGAQSGAVAKPSIGLQGSQRGSKGPQAPWSCHSCAPVWDHACIWVVLRGALPECQGGCPLGVPCSSEKCPCPDFINGLEGSLSLLGSLHTASRAPPFPSQHTIQGPLLDPARWARRGRTWPLPSRRPQLSDCPPATVSKHRSQLPSP